MPVTANPEQQALLQQVLSMTQQQIDLLPPDQRQTVMAIVSSVFASFPFDRPVRHLDGDPARSGSLALACASADSACLGLPSSVRCVQGVPYHTQCLNSDGMTEYLADAFRYLSPQRNSARR
jgi:hypothetical protein